jgi:hypothetical protein
MARYVNFLVESVALPLYAGLLAGEDGEGPTSNTNPKENGMGERKTLNGNGRGCDSPIGAVPMHHIWKEPRDLVLIIVSLVLR